jgi:hypothetical protein
MASAAQVQANRLNAQHSTGPRTPEGKAHSSANSLKAGFHASTLVIPEAMRAEFEQYRAALLKMTAPANVIEEQYYRRLLLHGWNLQRVQDSETQVLFDTELDGHHHLELLAKYRRDLERSFDRALKALRELQTERVLRATAPPDIRRALEHEAPLAVPPPVRPMSHEEEIELIEASIAPPVLSPGFIAQRQAQMASQRREGN